MTYVTSDIAFESSNPDQQNQTPICNRNSWLMICKLKI